MSGKVINVGFIGNPNCGKTTLFNAYTGANLKVANWPGVTVEKKEGKTFYKGQEFKLIDLPGIYSLTSYTMVRWTLSWMWRTLPVWREICI